MTDKPSFSIDRALKKLTDTFQRLGDENPTNAELLEHINKQCAELIELIKQIKVGGE